MMEVETVKADVLVVGGGGAASRAALSAVQAGADVRMVSKAPPQQGGSTVHGASEMMGMGAAAGFGDSRDKPEIHFHDTMGPARGFIDETLVRVLAEDATDRVRDLIELGVQFDRLDDGTYRLIRSDFGTYGRAMSVAGRTGKAFVAALSDALAAAGVAVDAPVALVDILRDADGRICGALAFDTQRLRFIHYRAPTLILGTGGMHGAFGLQVSTAEMMGDGQAIAYRHGAELVNMEFHQFGPAMFAPYIQLFSKSITVMRPRLTNARGEAFLSRYLPDGVSEGEVFDEKVFPFTTSNVSRYLDIAMAREINAGRGTAGGGVWFSFSHIPEETLKAGAPNTFRWLADRGLSMKDDPMEVGIAFQCMNGGVRMTGPTAECTIPGLFVIGETAGGVRGPDRPGGNSLAEGQVFGHRAGVAAAERAGKGEAGAPETLDESMAFLETVLARSNGCDIREIASVIRQKMQRHCLVEKDSAGLSETLATVNEARAELETAMAVTPETLVEGLGVRNMAQACEIVLAACLNREETRSSHNRVDFPERNDARFGGSFVVSRSDDGPVLTPHHYT
jgi:fumarate reductase (CoM/CoB) subunit A